MPAVTDSRLLMPGWHHTHTHSCCCPCRPRHCRLSSKRRWCSRTCTASWSTSHTASTHAWCRWAVVLTLSAAHSQLHPCNRSSLSLSFFFRLAGSYRHPRQRTANPPGSSPAAGVCGPGAKRQLSNCSLNGFSYEAAPSTPPLTAAPCVSSCTACSNKTADRQQQHLKTAGIGSGNNSSSRRHPRSSSRKAPAADSAACTAAVNRSSSEKVKGFWSASNSCGSCCRSSWGTA